MTKREFRRTVFADQTTAAKKNTERLGGVIDCTIQKAALSNTDVCKHHILLEWVSRWR